MAYKFIQGKNTLTAEIDAITIEDLFSLSCHVWKEAALESADSSSIEWKYATFKSDNYENLLTQLLNDLNIILYSRKWVFNSVDKIELNKKEDEIILNAEILGEPFNETVQKLKTEIKSILCEEIKTDETTQTVSAKIRFESV